ncbi:Tat pathway signal sequence domain protein [Streptomyces poonensis]|uniref:Tat pathway signal sequence domain protein n=1 Tax=Streptomyces poonensis TaxID=68255 RepID=A0A918Q209_9ACTN|nr:Tat pathway signal sequence domain protein [Streptomyces poonensis]GGZ31026.1 hypothetical protein GCM10010365_59470 [Streptomyces poonensis]GLJ88272.1 hypothetical protein GCM10017589_08720 [Streptomyces poonensis]
MSGISPVEPGEGTRAGDADPDSRPVPGTPRQRLTEWYTRHRRPMLAGASAAVLLAGGGSFYATRDKEPEPPAVHPSQTVRVTYLGAESPPPSAPTRSFSFAVRVTALPGPPVTVTRISQPYAAVSLTSAPRPPFSAKAGFARKIVITMHVMDCSHVPGNAGLPFLDVTLRNTNAIDNHSFILGERYAQDVSQALRAGCADDPESSPKPLNTTEIIRAHPASSHYPDRANQPEFRSSTHRVPLCNTSCHNKRVTASDRLSSAFPAHA